MWDSLQRLSAMVKSEGQVLVPGWQWMAMTYSPRKSGADPSSVLQKWKELERTASKSCHVMTHAQLLLLFASTAPFDIVKITFQKDWTLLNTILTSNTLGHKRVGMDTMLYTLHAQLPIAWHVHRRSVLSSRTQCLCWQTGDASKHSLTALGFRNGLGTSWNYG